MSSTEAVRWKRAVKHRQQVGEAADMSLDVRFWDLEAHGDSVG